MKLKVVALTLPLIIALAGCTTNDITYREQTGGLPGAKSNLLDFTSVSAIHKAIEEEKICAHSKNLLVSKSQFNLLQRKVNRLREIDDSDPRRAKAFLDQKNPPTALSTDAYFDKSIAYQDDLHPKMRDFLERTFFMFGFEDSKFLYEGDLELFLSDWREQLRNETTKYCKLNTEYSDNYYSLAEEHNSILESITSSAALVPWYPDGYSSWSGDSSLAWNWVSGGYCQLGDTCWQARVLTRDGCSSLYGELNIKDRSGNIIDYTNDLTGNLPPGASVILEFPTYNDFAHTGNLTTLRCR